MDKKKYMTEQEQHNAINWILGHDEVLGKVASAVEKSVLFMLGVLLFITLIK